MASWVTYVAQVAVWYFGLLAVAAVSGDSPGGPFALLLLVGMAAFHGGVATTLVVVPSVALGEWLARRCWYLRFLLPGLALAASVVLAVVGGGLKAWYGQGELVLAAGVLIGMNLLPYAACQLVVWGPGALLRVVRQRRPETG